jgi:hypothetical protein
VKAKKISKQPQNEFKKYYTDRLIKVEGGVSRSSGGALECAYLIRTQSGGVSLVPFSTAALESLSFEYDIWDSS